MEPDKDYIKMNTWAILDELNQKHNASDFGRINQALLSIAFQTAGFEVSHYQGTGRPDFIADRTLEGYAIEVKAPPSERVALTKEDITGVEKLGRKPLLAILSYPLLEAGWLLIETKKLSPRTYDKNELGKFSMKTLDEEIAPVFLNAMEQNKEKALIGAGALQSLVESKLKN